MGTGVGPSPRASPWGRSTSSVTRGLGGAPSWAPQAMWGRDPQSDQYRYLRDSRVTSATGVPCSRLPHAPPRPPSVPFHITATAPSPPVPPHCPPAVPLPIAPVPVQGVHDHSPGPCAGVLVQGPVASPQAVTDGHTPGAGLGPVQEPVDPVQGDPSRGSWARDHPQWHRWARGQGGSGGHQREWGELEGIGGTQRGPGGSCGGSGAPHGTWEGETGKPWGDLGALGGIGGHWGS